MAQPSFEIGDWVLVQYGNEKYPGEVKELGDKEIRVSVMMKSGSYFKWPVAEDKIFYKFENVIKKLQPPILKSSRNTFEFYDKWN